MVHLKIERAVVTGGEAAARVGPEGPEPFSGMLIRTDPVGNGKLLKVGFGFWE